MDRKTGPGRNPFVIHTSSVSTSQVPHSDTLLTHQNLAVLAAYLTRSHAQIAAAFLPTDQNIARDLDLLFGFVFRRAAKKNLHWAKLGESG